MRLFFDFTVEHPLGVLGPSQAQLAIQLVAVDALAIYRLCTLQRKEEILPVNAGGGVPQDFSELLQLLMGRYYRSSES